MDDFIYSLLADLDNFEIPAQDCNVCRYIVDEVEGVGLCWNVPEYRLIDLSQWSVLEPQDPDNGCNGSYSHTSQV